VGSVVDEEEELEEEEVGSDVESVEMDAAEGGKTRGIKLKKSGGLFGCCMGKKATPAAPVEEEEEEEEEE